MSKRVIKDTSTNTYYRGMSGIGPIFGGTLEEAQRFADDTEALAECRKHWVFGGTEICNVSDEPKKAPRHGK